MRNQNESNQKVYEINKKMKESNKQMKEGIKKVNDVNMKKRTRKY